jgi:DNA-directed RNA polymerase subunit RPC12/RpoP
MNKYQEAFEDLCITWDEEGMGKDHFKDQYPYLYNTIKELVDKETPKKPIETEYTNKCPRCKNQLPLKENALKKKTPKLYCDRCGQRIDWSKVSDK